jgi:hypothetical protein
MINRYEVVTAWLILIFGVVGAAVETLAGMVLSTSDFHWSLFIASAASRLPAFQHGPPEVILIPLIVNFAVWCVSLIVLAIFAKYRWTRRHALSSLYCDDKNPPTHGPGPGLSDH